VLVPLEFAEAVIVAVACIGIVWCVLEIADMVMSARADRRGDAESAAMDD
jgi:hypothetical protein